MSRLVRLVELKLNVDVTVIVLSGNFFSMLSILPLPIKLVPTPKLWFLLSADPASEPLVRERGKTSIQPCRQRVKGEDGRMVGRGSFGRTKKGVWLRDKQLRGAGECLANVGGRKNLANSRNEDIILQSSRSIERGSKGEIQMSRKHIARLALAHRSRRPVLSSLPSSPLRGGSTITVLISEIRVSSPPLTRSSFSPPFGASERAADRCGT